MRCSKRPPVATRRSLSTADNVTVEGFTFRGDFDYAGVPFGPGVSYTTGTVAVVGGANQSSECASGARILNNTFEGTKAPGLVGATSGELHFHRRDEHNCREGAVVEGNTIQWSANRNGIIMPDGSGACCADKRFCEAPAELMVIRDNEFRALSSGQRSNAIGGRAISDTVITRNRIYNGTSRARVGQSQTILLRDSKRVTVSNNFIDVWGDGATPGIFTQSNCGGGNVSNEGHVFVHNTFTGDPAAAIQFHDLQGVEVSGNIFAHDGAGIRTDSSTTGVGRNNLKFPASALCARSGFCPDSGAMFVDPMLGGANPWSLLDGSPAIDAGAASSRTPADDIDGDMRDASPDIGADEHGAAPPPPPPPDPVCGDGKIDAVLNEQCDGANLGDLTCTDVLASTTGDLSCFAPGTANECQFDTSDCLTPPPPPLPGLECTVSVPTETFDAPGEFTIPVRVFCIEK